MRLAQFSLFIAWASTMVPVAVAQTARTEIIRIQEILRVFENVLIALIVLGVSFAFLFFFWNIAVFILKLGTGEAKAFEEAKRRIVWGIVALFVLVSIWGIIYFFALILLDGNRGPQSSGTPNIQTFRLPPGRPAPVVVERGGASVPTSPDATNSQLPATTESNSQLPATTESNSQLPATTESDSQLPANSGAVE